MQFFALNGDFAHFAGKKVTEYFKKSCVDANGQIDKDVVTHREYVRDVLRLFADKTLLTFPQACMIARGYRLDEPHARRMHAKRRDTTSPTIMVMGEKKPNPFYKDLDDLAGLAPRGHLEFMKAGWIWATSLMHPLAKPITRGTSEMSKEKEAQIVKQIFRHEDETHKAHLERMAKALERAMNDPLFLQKASDHLMSRVEGALTAK